VKFFFKIFSNYFVFCKKNYNFIFLSKLKPSIKQAYIPFCSNNEINLGLLVSTSVYSYLAKSFGYAMRQILKSVAIDFVKTYFKNVLFFFSKKYFIN